MTDTDPAARLREAAAAIRKYAADATPGPWHRPLNTRTRSSVRAPLPEGERGTWIDGIDPDTGQREHCTVATIPIWSNGRFSRPRGGRDLEWIALMHPGVGEALVAWLEESASGYETETDTPDCPNCGEGCGGHSPQDFCTACGDAAPCRCIAAALAVADAVLGAPAQQPTA